MRVITWLLRAFLFFVLFAFAMNNQHEARLKWFFGYEWRAPMVVVVLAVFAFGCILGLLGQVPGWWRRLRSGKATQARGDLLAAKGAGGTALAGTALANARTAPAAAASDSTPGSGRASGAARERSAGAASVGADGLDTVIEPPRDGL